MDYARSDLADALAAQYVAGTLRGPARRRFEALLPSHPALRDAVGAWQGRLMPLTVVVDSVAPPKQVWSGIEDRLWASTRSVATPWWQRLGLWRAISGLAAVAAVALAVLVVNPAVQPPVVIVLQGTGAGSGAGSVQAAGFVASLSGDGRALVTQSIQPASLQADHSLELWAVPPKGTPRSLGVIAANGTTLVPSGKLRQSLLKGDTSALAVSLEPPGGSPTGLPTGPVLYAGKFAL